MSCTHFDHSLNSITLHGAMSLPKMIWTGYKMPFLTSIPVGRYSHLCVVEKVSCSLDNTLLYIIQHLSSFSEHLMVSVRQLPNQNTFAQLRSPGIVRVEMMLFFKCSRQINVSISLRLPTLTLLSEGCSMEH